VDVGEKEREVEIDLRVADGMRAELNQKCW
jgi:hypothetical protein